MMAVVWQRGFCVPLVRHTLEGACDDPSGLCWCIPAGAAGDPVLITNKAKILTNCRIIEGYVGRGRRGELQAFYSDESSGLLQRFLATLCSVNSGEATRRFETDERRCGAATRRFESD
ncbi:hypothetical protein SKAU_G00354920 [Synaphobranchus kaupii]|uniref:Uncharacterized protein n=1 Tax=Synaphobranchus kaupii TaxID=118154 RepID=A0A9Q1EH30_SYNKA|nr:hypothetical protein SKAU_G00354920 [Synaphobranchus kaupii]